MALEEKIAEYIREYGAISVAEYMEACVSHYYATRDPFGTSGDFTTAPEISQVFGELIGAWVTEKWQSLSGEHAILCEAGPGRGTLMKDLLRVTRNSGLHESTDVALIETSPILRAAQEKTLKHAHRRLNWYKSLESVPEMPFFFVANEFFDALPIHQYVGEEERHIRMTGNRLDFAPSGQVTREASPVSLEIMTEIVRRIKTHGGAALIIDYGYASESNGDSLQALKDHGFVDPLEYPGESDLTAHVDFLSLQNIAEDAGLHTSIMGQGAFLKSLHIDLRKEQLCASASSEQKEKIIAGIERLVTPEQMGILFKVLIITPEEL